MTFLQCLPRLRRYCNALREPDTSYLFRVRHLNAVPDLREECPQAFRLIALNCQRVTVQRASRAARVFQSRQQCGKVVRLGR